ncbi:virion structural protein [Pseudomonas phage D6]|nr:virion structural protein [Pseudomonas phage D6]
MIARILKELSAPKNNDRMARAMFVANAVGFHVPLMLDKTAAECAEAHNKTFRDICGQVNENLALDTKRAQDIFREIIRIRYELVAGVIDPSIVQAALCSSTMQDGLTREEFAMSEWLSSRPDFIRCQLEIADVLRQSAAEE